jgi:hypothetical protein
MNALAVAVFSLEPLLRPFASASGNLIEMTGADG